MFIEQEQEDLIIRTVSEFGTIFYKNKEGAYHRLNGPAVEFSDGRKYWYKNDKLHRIDGPAAEYPNGKKQYWIEGIECSIDEFLTSTNKFII